MHDISDLERRGTPGVFVASAPFVSAAKSQSNALGFPPAGLFTDHPIQDRTDEEMKALAMKIFDDLMQELLT
ncbi:MAG: hypothetical protein CL522_00795 [Actinobacteria bacterium]|nr:hypothetical protein [Actinomycetota bacterium]